MSVVLYFSSCPKQLIVPNFGKWIELHSNYLNIGVLITTHSKNLPKNGRMLRVDTHENVEEQKTIPPNLCLCIRLHWRRFAFFPY